MRGPARFAAKAAPAKLLHHSDLQTDVEYRLDMSLQGRSIEITGVVEWKDGRLRRYTDELAGEEPLEIRVGDVPVNVIMRTPGHDLELVVGFFFTEGLVQRREQILAMESLTETVTRGNVVRVELAPEALSGLDRLKRNFYAASGCGVCGKASIESLRVRMIGPPNPEFRATGTMLCDLPERLRDAQDIFGRTGGLHAAALFDTQGKMRVVREDIGRHNAVDKVIGWALREGMVPLDEYIMLVSGRGGFEIVQKAIVAGVPVLACVSAPSSLAVQMARELHLTLVGFLRGERFVVYAGEDRLRGRGENPVAARSAH